jgi:D-alanyl-D-alanine endopeptidase (penicillin-binding protein 7)
MIFRSPSLLAGLAALVFAFTPIAVQAHTGKHHKGAQKSHGHKVHSKNHKQLALNHSARGGHVTRVSTRASLLDTLEPALRSSAALVVNEESGERIYEKNAHSVTPIASVSKLMTAIVTLDMHLPLDERITITDDDIDHLKNTSSRLLVGTTLTRGEVMHLALMASENRAAHALARTSPYGMADFVARMNRTALSLGMPHTHFEDPTGLTSANVSTAEDLVHRVEAAHRYPEIRSFTTSESYSFVSSVNGREYEFHNTNPLVKTDSWEIGLSKTGYISEAGKCLVMMANIENTPVVIVLLDSVGKLTRVADANRIKRWLETSPAAKLRAG